MKGGDVNVALVRLAIVLSDSCRHLSWCQMWAFVFIYSCNCTCQLISCWHQLDSEQHVVSFLVPICTLPSWPGLKFP